MLSVFVLYIYKHRKISQVSDRIRNMPRKNWIHYLANARHEEDKRALASIMLTTGATREELEAINLHVPAPRNYFDDDYGMMALQLHQRMTQVKEIKEKDTAVVQEVTLHTIKNYLNIFTFTKRKIKIPQ
jgi:hypothetical protein